MVRSRSKWHALARLVRIEHTLFSLPYAYLGALIGVHVTIRIIILVTLAVFGLRIAAMSYNNIADLDIDRLNPRSRNRPLVSGAVSLKEAWVLVIIGSTLYYLSAALLNRIALILSPILWIVAMSYPHAKRLHNYPHLHLGLTLGLVVFGGTIASYGQRAEGVFDALIHVPWDLVIAVSCWVAGFDAIYSIMDVDFDKNYGLGSVPARHGIKGALYFSTLCHTVFLTLLGYTLLRYMLGLIGLVSYISTIILIIYEQWLVYRKGLGEVPRAFNLNLLIGLVVGIGYSLALI